jgi:hypothetical protein
MSIRHQPAFEALCSDCTDTIVLTAVAVEEAPLPTEEPIEEEFAEVERPVRPTCRPMILLAVFAALFPFIVALLAWGMSSHH